MIRIILLHISFLVLGGIAFAQPLAISYTTIPGIGNTDTLAVFMRSNTTNTIEVHAVNFSFAFQSTCANFQGVQALFTDEWTTFLEASTVDESVILSYAGITFNRRYKYGNANPGLPFTNAVIVPTVNQAPLLVMKLVYDGLCGELVYMENEQQNPVNQIGGINFISIPYSITPLNNAFPVEILNFEANIIDHETVQLDWKTSSETNNDYFLIEKSFDGMLFRTSSESRQEGAGTTTTETKYQHIDRGQMSTTVYYRLKQVDFDGSFTRSNVIEVHFDNLQPSFGLTVSAFPNPTTRILNVEVDAHENTSYEVKLLDSQGRVLQTKETMYGPSFAHRQPLQVEQYPSGIYFLVVTDINDSGNSHTIRVIKD